MVDAATRQPVKEFLVVPGVRWDARHMHWARDEGFPSEDGQFVYRPTRGELAHLVRIEADGYEVAVSREIKSTEGDVALDFELKRANNLVAKVVTPDLKPAAGASVAIGIAGSQISVKNGGSMTVRPSRPRIHGRRRPLRIPAAGPGFSARHHSPGRLRPGQVAAGLGHGEDHPAGAVGEGRRDIPGRRDAGARTCRSHPVLGRDEYGKDVPQISSEHEVTTGPDGRFAFDRVIPGRGRIGRGITFMVDDGATEVTSSCMIAADFPAGKTTHIDLGGTGRAVIGRLRPPEGAGKRSAGISRRSRPGRSGIRTRRPAPT